MLTHGYASPTTPSRVVILGSAGFVASATRRRLAALGAPILALARTDLDLCETNAGGRLAAILRPDDALLFVSAKAPVKDEAMLLANIQMGSAVCEALRAVAVGHVVYISSDAVYADSDGPLTERSCAQPASLHGVMHLTREVMLANAYGGALCFLRPTLIYGAADPHNGYGPNRFLRAAVAGEDIVLFGDGEERRDHVLVDDVAEIIVRSLFRRSFGKLNVASGTVKTFREIAEIVSSVSEGRGVIKSSPRIGPMPHGGYRAFDATASAKAFPDFRYTPIEHGLLLAQKEST